MVRSPVTKREASVAVPPHLRHPVPVSGVAVDQPHEGHEVVGPCVGRRERQRNQHEDGRVNHDRGAKQVALAGADKWRGGGAWGERW